MNTQILINKKYLFLCGIVHVVGLCLRTSLVADERSTAAGGAGIERLGRHDSVHGDETQRTIQALLEKGIRRCPSLIHGTIKDVGGKCRPEILANDPAIFLKKRPKLGLLKPEKPKVSMIGEGMLGAADTLEIHIVEPVHVCVRISRITRSAIHFTSVHLPEIGHNIDVIFRDIG